MQLADDSITVLHVDDDSEFGALTAELLEREDERFSVTTAASAEEGLDRLADAAFDCVVSDYEMPGRDGIEFLRAVRERYPDLPFVLFTGKGSEEVASEAISAGVTDYIQKTGTADQYALLVNRIANAVGGRLARQEADWQRTVLENMGEGVYVFDGDYVLQYVNFRVGDIDGLSEEEWVGHPLSYFVDIGLFSGAEADRVRHGIDQILADATDEVRLEIEPALPEPTHVLEFRLTAVASRADGDLVLGTTRDITDRKRREGELETVKAQYQTLVDNIPEMGVFLFDEDLTYRLVGGGELSEVGLSSADFHGQTPYDLFPDEIAEETAHYYREAIAGVENTYEQQYQGNQYLITTLPVRNEAGEFVSGLAVSRNVTEQREREAALQQRNEQLETFTSVVSHDLRNPLTIAQGRLELAQEECESDHLDDIDTALARSQGLIDDLLELARQGKGIGDPDAVALAAITEQCWRNVATGEATLRTETEQTVRADPSRLQQLLENLIRNGVEHGSTGNRTQSDDSIEHESTNDRSQAAGDDHHGAAVTVTVGDLDGGFYIADDGRGIDPDDYTTVFETGYSTAPGGTGFGLTIVQRIVDAHGWEISVTESAAGGTRFEITGVEVID